MAAVARATYNGWVSWGAYNLGLLSFDHSVFGGADVFGVSPLDSSFTGPYDDVSARLAQVGVKRGRSSNLDQVLAGNANLDLRDPDGLFNPNNPGSPLNGQLSDRLQPVKLTASYGGTSYGLFYGWVRRFTWEPHGRRGITRLECVDLFYWLERANPIIASTGPTTTGAAIGLILDAVGATDPGMRDLDQGDAIPDFSADGSKNGLQLVADLLAAERGVFFIAGTGKATYRSRLSRLTRVPVTTLTYGSGTYGSGVYGGSLDAVPSITDIMSGGSPGVDWDQAYTRVTVKRSQNGYTATAYDSAVVPKVGYNDLPTIETPYLLSDAQADGLAQWVLSQSVDPRPPLRDLAIDNRDPGLLTQALARELVDRVSIAAARGGTAGDFNIDSLEHTIDGASGRHTTAWLLSETAQKPPLVFGTATFDTGVFVY